MRISPTDASSPVEEGENRLKGKLRDIIFKGQYSDYFIILENGAELVVSDASGIPAIEIRHTVEVCWPPEAGYAFAEGD